MHGISPSPTILLGFIAITAALCDDLLKSRSFSPALLSLPLPCMPLLYSTLPYGIVLYEDNRRRLLVLVIKIIVIVVLVSHSLVFVLFCFFLNIFGIIPIYFAGSGSGILLFIHRVNHPNSFVALL